MAEVKRVAGILDVIKSITANGESGRLEIGSPETHGPGLHGVLLFVEGKLVDARLESLSGFQAVNAALALRDVEFSFDHVVPAPHAVCITPSERVVLKRLFGIEAADAAEPIALAETDAAWNEAPEQVVPLTEVEELPQTRLEETPTVEVAALPVQSVAAVPSVPVSSAGRFAFFMRPQFVAVCLVLLLGLVAGAITLRSRIKARQQAAAVASVVASNTSSVSNGAAEVVPVANASTSVDPVRRESAAVKPVPRESPRESASVQAAPRESPSVKPVPKESPAVAVSQPPNEVHDLNGVWRVVNTVEKTNYKSFQKMQLGFRLKIDQKGKEFTARGEKFSENGQTLPANSRTPIELTGSIEGDKIVATFVEDGRLRRSNGRFVWKLQSSGDRLTGTFASTAANVSGRSAVMKEQ